MWSIHTMEYYSALKEKRKENVTRATTRVNIMLSEIYQSQETSTVWFHLREVPRIFTFIRQNVEWGLPGAGAWERGSRVWPVSVWQDKECFRDGRWWWFAPCECPKCHPTVYIYIYIFFFAVPRGLWDLSSPIGDRNQAPEVEAWSLNHWTAREVL